MAAGGRRPDIGTTWSVRTRFCPSVICRRILFLTYVSTLSGEEHQRWPPFVISRESKEELEQIAEILNKRSWPLNIGLANEGQTGCIPGSLPVYDDGVRGRLVPVPAALLVTTPTTKQEISKSLNITGERKHNYDICCHI